MLVRSISPTFIPTRGKKAQQHRSEVFFTAGQEPKESKPQKVNWIVPAIAPLPNLFGSFALMVSAFFPNHSTMEEIKGCLDNHRAPAITSAHSTVNSKQACLAEIEGNAKNFAEFLVQSGLPLNRENMTAFGQLLAGVGLAFGNLNGFNSGKTIKNAGITYGNAVAGIGSTGLALSGITSIMSGGSFQLTPELQALLLTVYNVGIAGIFNGLAAQFEDQEARHDGWNAALQDQTALPQAIIKGPK